MEEKSKNNVVEDDQALIDLYVIIRQDAGFAVDQAADGEEAYELLKKGGYDLVLLDIVLPKLAGIHLLENLHQSPPSLPNKKIVVLSNLGHDEIIGNAISLGASGYLIKSDYTPEESGSRVKE